MKTNKNPVAPLGHLKGYTALGVLLVGLLALASCGGSGSSDPAAVSKPTSIQSSSTSTPAPPPPSTAVDMFTSAANGDGTYTLTWNTTSSTAGLCYVEQLNSQGVQVALIPGGTPSGSATTAVLSPTYRPFSFTLYCGGNPDPSVQTITVMPPMNFTLNAQTGYFLVCTAPQIIVNNVCVLP
jgi:hypothetical protein